MKFSFWLLLALVLYCYFGYPLLIAFWARLFRRPVEKSLAPASVSVVMSVCNEDDVLEQKIKNLLSLEYPSADWEILIGSDGSDDRTSFILGSITDLRVKSFLFSQRRGKVAVLNDLLPKAKGEIIVFSDARQEFAQDAVKQLAANFQDPRVGCVSGELILGKSSEATGKGINLYWKYEKFLRRCESEVHSMLGATGAIYAIRRELFSAPPPNVVLDDMYIPLKTVEKGYRAILDESAKAFDQVAEDPQVEHARKARTLSGNYQIFFLLPGLLNPLKSPVAIQMVSHKVLRLLVPFFLAGLLVTNALLVTAGGYRNLFCLQVAFYGAALLGYLSRRPEFAVLKPIARICYVPYVFCLLNGSALAGFMRFIGQQQSVTWEKARKVRKNG